MNEGITKPVSGEVEEDPSEDSKDEGFIEEDEDEEFEDDEEDEDGFE